MFVCEHALTNQSCIKIVIACKPIFICIAQNYNFPQRALHLKVGCVSLFQLTQAQTGKFNVHVHVEYEWRLRNEDLDESEDEMEDKVGWFHVKHLEDM